MKTSWVTLDRLADEQSRRDRKLRQRVDATHRPLRHDAERLTDDELLEKLHGFDPELDRSTLEQLCDGAVSAQEVAEPLIERRGFKTAEEERQGEWIWISITALWQRWWPDRVCLELLDDKIQAGYRHIEQRRTAKGARSWIGAWEDVLKLVDITGIHSINDFDDRFPLTQSLYNWSQDLEDGLWNAGLDDPQFLRARISICEEALAMFPHEDQLMTENRRRALAESLFEVGETGRAEELYASWLTDDPRWGWGWIGWSDCHWKWRRGRSKDHGRGEEILRRGYSVPGVRDLEDIAERLSELCQEIGRRAEARELGREADRLRRARQAALSSRAELDVTDEGSAVVRQTATLTFDGEGPPLERLPEVIRAGRAALQPPRSAKVGRNETCPCGSGRKFKRCCGLKP